MKLWLVVISLAALLSVGLGCSCVAEDVNRPRDQSIIENYRSSYNPMIYIARVVEARCNCFNPNSTGEATCREYAVSPSGVAARELATGTCDEGLVLSTGALRTCDQLGTELSVDPGVVVDQAESESINLTSYATGAPYCSLSCQFNLAAGISDRFDRIQPCEYTVEVEEIFKPANYDGSTTLRVFGPDVLTTCGDFGRILSIGSRYVAGIGGGCDSIAAWSALESYSDDEIMLLRELQAAGGGAVITFPSLLLLALVAIMAVLL